MITIDAPREAMGAHSLAVSADARQDVEADSVAYDTVVRLSLPVSIRIVPSVERLIIAIPGL